MFKFDNEQRIFDIGGIKVGGQPGQLPTVMMGSIFYHKHKIVNDEIEGLFDREKAEELLRTEGEISAHTGNPRIIDVVGATPKAIEKYIDFIAEATEAPFLIDGVSADARIAGVKHVSEVGLTHRAIYNSITYAITPQEVKAIEDAGLESAIILAFNPKKPILDGRLEILKGTPEKKGLLEIAREANIIQPLVDPAILDIPDPGSCAKFIYLVKKEYGFPAGCGAHNAVDLLRSRKKLDSTMHLTINAVAQTIPITMGANFALYGPIESAPYIYPPVAFADAYIAYGMRQEFNIRPLTKEHPLFKVFR